MKSKYNSLAEWRKANPSGCESARTRDLIVKICETFGWEYKPMLNNKPSGYWTKEKCIEESKKHKYASDWEHACGGTYSSARTNGWYQECTTHMGRKIKPISYWTKEKCIEEARKYQYKEDWKKNSSGSNNSARRNGWYLECVAHMIPVRFKWDKESLLEEANKYKTTSEFLKFSNGAYQVAIKLGCLAYVTQNLKNTRQVKWTLERCKLESIKYNTRGEWQKESNNSYNAARRNNWVDECSIHMVSKKKK